MVEEAGYYWVKLLCTGELTIGETDGKDWTLVGTDEGFTKTQVQVISKRIVEPKW